MTVDEAYEFLKADPVLKRKLATLKRVGLGYVRLGQPAPTLSGGEAQRIKLTKELGRKGTGRTLYLLDEPTTGLHFDDVRKLLEVLAELAAMGNTVLVIEHNLDVIKFCDYIIDLGPEGGEEGGWIVAQGTPEDVAAVEGSHTGRFLKKALGGGPPDEGRLGIMAFKDIAGNEPGQARPADGPPEAQASEFAPVLRPGRRGQERDGHDRGQGPELRNPRGRRLRRVCVLPGDQEAFQDPEKQGLAPDVMFIEIQESKKKIAIEQIRLLKQTAYLRPMSPRTRVFIVRGADAMSEDASHSILKVLEEPPRRFDPYPGHRETAPHPAHDPVPVPDPGILPRRPGGDRPGARRGGQPADRANLLAFLANGSMEDALDRDWDEILEGRRGAWDLFRALLTGGGGSDFLNEFAFVTRAMGGDDLRRTLELFASFARDVILVKEGGESRYPPQSRPRGRVPGRRKGAWSLERLRTAWPRSDLFSALSGDRNLNMNLNPAARSIRISGNETMSEIICLLSEINGKDHPRPKGRRVLEPRGLLHRGIGARGRPGRRRRRREPGLL